MLPSVSCHASPASSATLGFGATARCPHAEQNEPFSAAPQLEAVSHQRLAADHPVIVTGSIDPQCHGGCRVWNANTDDGD